MMMPSLSVVQTDPSRRRNEAPALSSPPNPSEPSSKPLDKPFEADRHLDELPPLFRCHSVNQAAADERLTDTGVWLPPWTVLKRDMRSRPRDNGLDSSSPTLARDDAVPVAVRIVAEGDIEAIFQRDEVRHGIGRRAVHANLAVPIERHETERRIDGDRFTTSMFKPIVLRDRLPVGHTGAAERIDAELQAWLMRITSMSMIVREITRCRYRDNRSGGSWLPAGHGHRECAARHADRPSIRALARSSIHLVTSVSAGPPCGGLYLNAAVLRRIVRGRDDDAVGEAARPAAVVGEDGVGDDRSRRIAAIPIDHDLDAIGREHL